MASPGSGEPHPRPRLTTARRKSLVLDLLCQGHTLPHVKEVLGINRVTVFRWRQNDEAFAKAYSDAMEAGGEVIEQEARRRAVEGYDRPVFQRGSLAGIERVYSDMLLALVLRGRRPELFRDAAKGIAPATSITIRGGLPEDTVPSAAGNPKQPSHGRAR